MIKKNKINKINNISFPRFGPFHPASAFYLIAVFAITVFSQFMLVYTHLSSPYFNNLSIAIDSLFLFLLYPQFILNRELDPYKYYTSLLKMNLVDVFLEVLGFVPFFRFDFKFDMLFYFSDNFNFGVFKELVAPITFKSPNLSKKSNYKYNCRIFVNCIANINSIGCFSSIYSIFIFLSSFFFAFWMVFISHVLSLNIGQPKHKYKL